MRKLFYLIAAGCVSLSVISCSNSKNSADTDSVAADDSIVAVDNNGAEDSIAKAQADSIMRADSKAQADSIAKAKAEEAKVDESSRDKSIDKDLDYVASVSKEMKEFQGGGGAMYLAQEAEKAENVLKSLKGKVDKMSPEQLARYNKLKKAF